MSEQQHLRDIYGPAEPWAAELPEGSTVGTTYQFVGFSIGWNKEHLLLPDDADKLADLLRQAAAKCRQITEAQDRARTQERGLP